MRLIEKLPLVIKEHIESEHVEYSDGYVRLLSDIYVERVSELLKSSSIWNNGIPFAITVFGDVLAWEEGYVVLYNLTEEDYHVILSGADFLFANLDDEEYQKDYFDMDLFAAAVKKCGTISQNQCYTFEPIPRLGGARTERYLGVGDLLSYIQILV